jgi:murein DD-endopeptidase MepM/ murein hydrolase activator NlpD
MARHVCIAVLLFGSLLLHGCGSTPPPPPEVKPRYEVYCVQQGDTLAAVGRRYGVPWQAIQQVNKCEPTALRPGQVLLIPIHSRNAEPRPGPRPPEPQPPPKAVEQPRGGPYPLIDVKEADLHKGRPQRTYWWPTAGLVSRRWRDPVRGLPEPGIGITAPAGTEVCSIGWGRVLCAVTAPRGDDEGWSKVLCIRHSGGIVSWYGCLDQIGVREGQQVSRGQRIGSVGLAASGKPELAFRIFKDERPVDPSGYLP